MNFWIVDNSVTPTIIDINIRWSSESIPSVGGTRFESLHFAFGKVVLRHWSACRHSFLCRIPYAQPDAAILSGSGRALRSLCGARLWRGHGGCLALALPGIPVPGAGAQKTAKWIAVILRIRTAGLFLWKAAEWQNTVRGLMGLGRVESVEPFEIGAIAFGIFLVIVVLARLFRRTFRLFSRWVNRVVPRCVSKVVGGVLALALFWSVAQGVLFKVVLRMVDTFFRELDARIDDGSTRPLDPTKPGGPGSTLDWQDLGRQGRAFIASGPTGAQIGNFFNARALGPVRIVYLQYASDPVTFFDFHAL